MTCACVCILIATARDGDFDVTIEKILRKNLQKQTKWVHQLDYATSGIQATIYETVGRLLDIVLMMLLCTQEFYVWL